MRLLYPCHPLKANLPDDQFVAEVGAVRACGFEVSLFSLEKLQCSNFRAFPSLTNGARVLYRGWMLCTEDYGNLVSALSSVGSSPVISLEAYLASHHLPNWYPLIKDLTPETRIYPPDCDLEAELRSLDWPEYFIKDYVKSLKTSVGSRISRPEQVSAVVSDMRRFRGAIEGGFCVRRVESFLSDTERRYFVLDGVPHSASGDVPPIVRECARRLVSRLYSVDVVLRTDGQPRVVEIGDGQVSDLVGWTPTQFAEILIEFGRKTIEP